MNSWCLLERKFVDVILPSKYGMTCLIPDSLYVEIFQIQERFLVVSSRYFGCHEKNKEFKNGKINMFVLFIYSLFMTNLDAYMSVRSSVRFFYVFILLNAYEVSVNFNSQNIVHCVHIYIM